MDFNGIIHWTWMFWIFIWHFFILFISDAQKKDYQVYGHFEMKYPKAFPIFFNILLGFAFIVFGILFILSKNKSLQDITIFTCVLESSLRNFMKIAWRNLNTLHL